LQALGEKELTKRIDYGQELAEHAEANIKERRHWERVSHASLSIVNFRYNNPQLTKEQNQYLVESAAKRIAFSGYAAVYTTRLNGNRVFRMCTINPQTSKSDINETIRRLQYYIDDQVSELVVNDLD